MLGLGALLFAASALAASGTNTPAPGVGVRADGSVRVSVTAEAEPGKGRAVIHREFSFGLPASSPTRRGFEGDKLPIVRTQWVQNGIRYTQTVLLTLLRPDEWLLDGALLEDFVLLVQIMGENTASEYTEATAEFAAWADRRMLELELRDGRVHASGVGGTRALAVIEVPATGVAGTRGGSLQFRGAMPPGTSGAMTIKIPLAPLKDEAAASRLSELEFDGEFRRVKRFWTERLKAGAPVSLPLALAGSEEELPGRAATESR